MELHEIKGLTAFSESKGYSVRDLKYMAKFAERLLDKKLCKRCLYNHLIKIVQQKQIQADASHLRKASAFFRWQLIICAKCPEEYIKFRTHAALVDAPATHYSKQCD